MIPVCDRLTKMSLRSGFISEESIDLAFEIYYYISNLLSTDISRIRKYVIESGAYLVSGT